MLKFFLNAFLAGDNKNKPIKHSELMLQWKFCDYDKKSPKGFRYLVC